MTVSYFNVGGKPSTAYSDTWQLQLQTDILHWLQQTAVRNVLLSKGFVCNLRTFCMWASKSKYIL